MNEWNTASDTSTCFLGVERDCNYVFKSVAVQSDQLHTREFLFYYWTETELNIVVVFLRYSTKIMTGQRPVLPPSSQIPPLPIISQSDA
jgi:hypothetical protein